MIILYCIITFEKTMLDDDGADRIVFSTVPIDIVKRDRDTDDRIGFGTGFFYGFNEHLYLVTAKHCFFEAKKEFYPTHFKIALHLKSRETLREIDFEFINLYNNNIVNSSNKLWLESNVNTSVDVAAIKLDNNIREKYEIEFFGKGKLLPTNRALPPAEDLIVVGYPNELYDKHNYLPIFKGASLASVYRTHFNHNPYFLIDPEQVQGMSGSPVIVKPKNYQFQKNGEMINANEIKNRLIGIYTGAFDNQKLGIVWYSELLQHDIIRYNQKYSWEGFL